MRFIEREGGKMQSAVEKRRAVLINTAYFGLILAGFYLFIKYAFWLFAPFIFAFIVASILQRPRNAIVKHTIFKKGITSAVLVLLSISVVLTVFVLLGLKIGSEAEGIINIAMDYIKRLPEFIKEIEASLIEYAKVLPDGLENEFVQAVSGFTNNLINSSGDAAAITSPSGFNILSILKTPLNGVWNTAKQIPSMLVSFLIFLIASCFMTSDYDRIVSFIKNQFSPEKRRKLEATKTIAFSSVGKLIKSYIFIMFITFVEMSIGLSVFTALKIYSGKYIFIIALGTALVDIFPVLGTGTILIPWALISLLLGNYPFAIAVVILYVCITVIRQIIEPKIVANNLGIPPILSLMGMYIGLKLFGVIGLFLMPITITVLKVLNDKGVVRLWRRSDSALEDNKNEKQKQKLFKKRTKQSKNEEKQNVSEK